MMLKAGDAAPEFALKDENGETVQLSDYRGKQPVVLVFYPGDSTYLCRKQLCEIRDSFEGLRSAGAVVFGLNPFSAESHRRFTESDRLPFRLLVDERLHVARQYKCVMGWGPLSMVWRCVYIVGLDGRIEWAKSGSPSPAVILDHLPKSGL
jgi:thioredoxin-dependent peroxiredoxin